MITFTITDNKNKRSHFESCLLLKLEAVLDVMMCSCEGNNQKHYCQYCVVLSASWVIFQYNQRVKCSLLV